MNDPEHKMHPDVHLLFQAVQSRDDQIAALVTAVQDMPDRIGAATQSAILRSVSDPATWSAAGAALKRHARDEAGGFLLGGIRSVLTKFAWVAVFVGSVYLVGGWSAVATAWKAIFAGHGT